MLACTKKSRDCLNLAVLHHAIHIRCRCTSTSTGMKTLLQRYIDGSVMEPLEKHFVRQELLKHDMDMHPSHAASLLYTRIDGYENIMEPILNGLERKMCDTRDDRNEEEGRLVAESLEGPDVDAPRRKDLTHMEMITIDDESTTEIDDGLSATLVDSGTISVSIHIADPTRWLADPSAPLAMNARSRGQTLYLPHKKVSMLPVSLGAGVCSLREGVATPALTMSCSVRISDGSIVEESIDIVPSMVLSNKKLSYDTVDTYIEETTGTTSDVIHLLHIAAESRARKRHACGALTLYPTNDVSLKASLHPYMVDITNEKGPGSSKSRNLVSEMMILAGEIFGQVGKQHGIPLPYRGQQIPVLPTTEDLIKYPEGPCRNYYRRRYMLKSIVNAHAPQIHQSLGLDQYVQSTSPIRRYMDMLAHWQMKSMLRGGNPMYSPQELQDIIDEVTRTNTGLNILKRKIEDTWLCAHLSEFQNKKLDATVLHWINQEHSLAIVYVSCIGREVVASVHTPVTLGGAVTVYCIHTDPLTQTLSFSTTPNVHGQ